MSKSHPLAILGLSLLVLSTAACVRTAKEPSVPTASGEAAAPAPTAKALWPDVSAPLAVDPKGAKDAAVIVAIEDYAFLDDVPGAELNGQDWFRYLTDVQKVPAQNVRLLFSKEATREDILEAVQQMRAVARLGGKLWLIYIGHGAAKQDGSGGLLIPVDAQQRLPSFEARGLPQADLLAALAQTKATPVAIIDACYSGKGSSGAALIPNLQLSTVIENEPVAQHAVVLTAAHNDQVAGPLPGAARPAFSYLALGAMRGWGDANSDGKVTAQEVTDYSKITLGALLSGERRQTPEVQGLIQTTLGEGKEQGPALAELMLNLRNDLGTALPVEPTQPASASPPAVAAVSAPPQGHSSPAPLAPSTSVTMPSVSAPPSARETTPLSAPTRDIPVSGEPFDTRGKAQVGAGLAFGAVTGSEEVNPYGTGLALFGGYTFQSNVHVAARFVYFAGEKESEGGISASMNVWLLGAEAGYDFPLGSSLVLRPKLGFAYAQVSAEVASGSIAENGSMSDLAILPGASGLFRLGDWALQGDVYYSAFSPEEDVKLNGIVFGVGAGYLL